MKVKAFFNWADEQHKIEMKIMKGKGREYTMNDIDKLKNFKFIAERLKDKPEKVANPTNHTLYIRGYRAGLKAGYKKGLQAPGIVEQAMEDMFQLFKGDKI